jgi:hypothetical protein
MRWTSAVARPLCVIVMLPALAKPASADPEPTKAACKDAYEQSQAHRQKDELLVARQQLLLCAAPACPNLIRNDCVVWFAQVEQAIPSVVLEAKNEGGEILDVTVTMDKKTIATQLDGQPIDIDPGLHTFRFEHTGLPPIEQRLIVRAGEKSRLVSASWAKPKAEQPADVPARAPAPMERPVPASVWIAAGVGIVGIAGFSYFGLAGNRKTNDLENSCAPFCSTDQVNTVKTDYLVGDISLGVGVVSLGAALVLLLTRPERPVGTETATSTAPRFGFQTTRDGAVVDLNGVF